MRRRYTIIINAVIVALSMLVAIIGAVSESFDYSIWNAIVIAVLGIGAVYLVESLIYKKVWMWGTALTIIMIGAIALPFSMGWHADGHTLIVLLATVILLMVLIVLRFAFKMQSAITADNQKPDYVSYHERKAQATPPSEPAEEPVFVHSKAMDEE